MVAPLIPPSTERSDMPKNVRSTDPFAEALAYTVEHGGGTFWAETCQPFRPDSGYSVAIGGVILDPALTGVLRFRNAWKHVASEFMTPHVATRLVGTWLDGQWDFDTNLYVDAVMYYPAWQREYAIADGRRHKQLAIYDFETGESIMLNTEVL
jgi:hypothetical protein